MKLGLSSFTYGWAVGVDGSLPPQPLDEVGLLARAREHNIKLLQIGDNLPLHTFDDDRLARLSRLAADQGVRLEIGARRLTVDKIAQYASIARQLGVTLIRFVIDAKDYHPSPSEVSAILRRAAPLIDGLTLAIENHDRFRAATLRTIIESAGDDRIGVCLDTANSLGAGEGLAAVTAVLAPIAVNLHIKDFQIERSPSLMGFTVTGRPAGRGMMDLHAVLNALAPLKRCHTALLELWTTPELQLADTIAKEAAWAAESLRFLRPLFPES